MVEAEYKLWNKVTKGIGCLYKEYCVQLYPFKHMSMNSEICTEKYYNSIIKNGVIFWQDSFWLNSNNYCVKSDGNFRKRMLLSPVMYMYYLLIGEYINDMYTSERYQNIKCYYTGKLNKKVSSEYHYKNQYNIFCNTLMKAKREYEFCFETDFSDFFNSINIDKLMKQIENRANKSKNKLNEKNILIIKEFLKYCGYGNMPQTENGVTSSYLATEVYLEEFDNKLYDFLKKLDIIKNFKIIRYVDDLYIFFNKEQQNIDLKHVENVLLTKLIDNANIIGLSINISKTKLVRGEDIDKRKLTKLSLLEDYVEELEISEVIDNIKIIDFIKRIDNIYQKDGIKREEYYKAVDEIFVIDNIEYSPNEIYNFLVHRLDKQFFKESNLENYIRDILIKKWDIIKFDPTRVIKIILNSTDGIIKAFLNKLFLVSRENNWTNYDTICITQYLLNRSFKHKDLINILKIQDEKAYNYYTNFCCKDWTKTFFDNDIKRKFVSDIFIDTIQGRRIFFTYYLYQITKDRTDNLLKSMYFRNFFDGISAHIGKKESNKNFSYNSYYREENLKKLYKDIISDTDTCISNICKRRNKNPVAHISGEIVDKDMFNSILEEDIVVMEKLMYKKIEKF